MGKVTSPKLRPTWKRRHKLSDRAIEQIEARLVDTPRGGKVLVLTGKRRLKIYLVPRDARGGDVIIAPTTTDFVSFLHHIDIHDAGGGSVLVALYFDSFSLDFFMRNAEAMVKNDDFPFDEMAVAASSCLFEVLLPDRDFVGLDRTLQAAQKGNPIVQGLRAGTWWILTERSRFAPNTIMVTKTVPFAGSNDPLSILTAGEDTVAVMSGLRAPPLDMLRVLVRISHEDDGESYPRL
ncbi:MAG TPA: hypothetical protein VJ276_00940 [Thermoanaerobaculia bacterium]|nr:hypothetical protein [Thermoanaerobaculia bacterium]